MANESLTQVAKKLEAEVRRIVRAFEVHKLSSRERKILAELSQNLEDIRIYTRAYEASDIEAEKTKYATQSKKWLAAARKNILAASESDIFGAADVAHLSALIEQAIGELSNE